MVVYELSLTVKFKPVIKRRVQTAKCRRNGQPAAFCQFLTGVCRSSQLACTDEPRIDPHRLGVNVYESTTEAYRLEVV